MFAKFPLVAVVITLWLPYCPLLIYKVPLVTSVINLPIVLLLSVFGIPLLEVNSSLPTDYVSPTKLVPILYFPSLYPTIYKSFTLEPLAPPILSVE